MGRDDNIEANFESSPRSSMNYGPRISREEKSKNKLAFSIGHMAVSNQKHSAATSHGTQNRTAKKTVNFSSSVTSLRMSRIALLRAASKLHTSNSEIDSNVYNNTITRSNLAMPMPLQDRHSSEFSSTNRSRTTYKAVSVRSSLDESRKGIVDREKVHKDRDGLHRYGVDGKSDKVTVNAFPLADESVRALHSKSNPISRTESLEDINDVAKYCSSKKPPLPRNQQVNVGRTRYARSQSFGSAEAFKNPKQSSENQWTKISNNMLTPVAVGSRETEKIDAPKKTSVHEIRFSTNGRGEEKRERFSSDRVSTSSRRKRFNPNRKVTFKL